VLDAKAWLLALPIGLGLALTLACAPRPSPDECQAMVDHIVALTREAHEGRAAEIAATVTQAHRDSLRDQCLDEGTQREVACVLGATSLDAIHECAPSK
jgi:small lipoprotein (TIGR04454 family)